MFMCLNTIDNIYAHILSINIVMGSSFEKYIEAKNTITQKQGNKNVS